MKQSGQKNAHKGFPIKKSTWVERYLLKTTKDVKQGTFTGHLCHPLRVEIPLGAADKIQLPTARPNSCKFIEFVVN
jgi:hypothetical protein